MYYPTDYTVCGSCYQQRNKGSFCPLCRRAYRAAAYRDMIRCTACRRYCSIHVYPHLYYLTDYTVCGSCYQQRNKGSFCPLCRRAYRDMICCTACRRYCSIHVYPLLYYPTDYTVCGSCYQQRNEGSFCPLCRRAYRAAAYRDMIRCTACRRYCSIRVYPHLFYPTDYTVCGSCYQQRNEGSFCPLCRRAYRAAAYRDMICCTACRRYCSIHVYPHLYYPTDYTVCGSCYQQRNKGSFCPLCRRAYRAAAYRDMIRCTACRRYCSIHVYPHLYYPTDYTVCGSCYQPRNEGAVCPLCRRAYRAAAYRDMIRCTACRRYCSIHVYPHLYYPTDYTVCGSCYQQRNKGSFCPLCRRAYRDMIRCTACRRYCSIHVYPHLYYPTDYTVCGSTYQQRNEGSFCPLCRRAYRAAAYRDMIRCTACRRYVHGACDPEAEPQQYRQKKDQNPAYEYNCPICKAHMQLTGSKSGSFEEDSLTQSGQDSSYGDENSQEQDPLAIEPKGDVGLGKGKPFSVSSKVAKKKIGGYKLKGGYPPAGKLGFQKRQRSVLEFGRKRGSKPKMRGVFGVPGLGLQRPQAPDNKTQEDDPGVENKLVLCSSKDKFVLTQDLCVMCGAIGTDSEGCLIACAQCGQTYHPYCVNIKVSQVIVRQGWRCLDCTVCEGCGTRGDEALLVLCDDCDTAWHTYCARPQLGDVPRGAWRCERCRRCLVCGTRDTRAWRDNYTECAPCASLVMCCVCSEPYSDGELIIQCETCRRWLHASCDSIRNENDAEICCRAGYKCVMCRGREVPPPHVAQAAAAQAVAACAGGAAGLGGTGAGARAGAAPRLTAQELGLAGEYYVDDVCLSQRGAHHMKQLEADMGITHTRRKRRFKNDNTDKDAVVQNADNELAEDSKPDSTAEVKDEPGVSSNTNHKEGTLWNVANDGPPPEGFTVYTIESGLTVLRRKRQRNLNKLGIGGFVVRQRQTTIKAQADEEKDGDGTQASGESPSNKRKPRRKPRSKLMEQFPSYMQEAFFGKELLEPVKPAVSSTGNNPSESPGGSVRATTPEGYRELRDFKLDFENSDSEGEDVLGALTTFNDHDTSFVISLNTEEIELLNSLKPKEEKDDSSTSLNPDGTVKIKLENPEDGHLKHTEDSTALKNAILGPQTNESEQSSTATPENIPTVHSTKTETVSSETGGSSQGSTISPKDDLSLLGVNLDAMVRDTLPDMDGNDVDEIFKGVLTDDSQESQESSVSYVNSMASTPYSQQRQQLQSPMDYASPYHTEFGSSSNSALSPLFSECGSGGWGEQAAAPPPSYNQRSADKMRADESECPSPAPSYSAAVLGVRVGWLGRAGGRAAAPTTSAAPTRCAPTRVSVPPPRPLIVRLFSECGSGGWGEQAGAPPPSYNQRSADESECPSPAPSYSAAVLGVRVGRLGRAGGRAAALLQSAQRRQDARRRE
ncbi:unnamed protein product [Parnassius apollo]|uniref:(apollo) hypothetical protein n=1 Tax=Parnassius apollo TaxID=110799 RepID=A0A8S3X1H1_PARAO|nr:unnamed protein product [Parnassius apollo]